MLAAQARQRTSGVARRAASLPGERRQVALKYMTARGCHLEVLPVHAESADIKRSSPDGVEPPAPAPALPHRPGIAAWPPLAALSGHTRSSAVDEPVRGGGPDPPGAGRKQEPPSNCPGLYTLVPVARGRPQARAAILQAEKIATHQNPGCPAR